LEVMLYQLEVQQDIAGEHWVLTRAWNPALKRKLVPAFQ
jgi:hypothetical protein